MKERRYKNLQFFSEKAMVLTMVLFIIVMQVAKFLSWELGLDSDANAIISNGRVCKSTIILSCKLYRSFNTIYLLLVLVPSVYI